jgi:hypothetical protein
MKKILLLIIGVNLSLFTWAQTPRVDTVAVMILNRMADVIGDLHSCSFTLITSADEQDQEFGLVKHTGTSDVYMAGPDKMLVHSYGDKGHRGFWYNGWQIACYSFDENNYAIVDAPPNIIDAIDTINKNYGIEFPAADFFYPTFTDDILAQFETIVYLGKEKLREQECFHILASNKDLSVQFWIANDAYNLPQKFIIIYKNEGNKQYDATFSNWQLNPEIPVSVFEFMPPPKAAEITLMPR